MYNIVIRLLPLIRQHWRAAALVAVLLATSGYIAKLHYDLHQGEVREASLVADVERAKRSLGVCEGNVSELRSAIKEQNRKVEEMARQGERVASESAKNATEVLKKPLPTLQGRGAKALNKWLESQ